MSCHSPGTRKSAVSRQCALVDVHEERISNHDVGGVMTIDRENEPE